MTAAPTDEDLSEFSVSDQAPTWDEIVQDAEVLEAKLAAGEGVSVQGKGRSPAGHEQKGRGKGGWKHTTRSRGGRDLGRGGGGRGRGAGSDIQPSVSSPVTQALQSALSLRAGQPVPGTPPVDTAAAEEIDAISARSEALSDTVSDMHTQLSTAIERIATLEKDNSTLQYAIQTIRREIAEMRAAANRATLMAMPPPQLGIGKSDAGSGEKPTAKGASMVIAPPADTTDMTLAGAPKPKTIRKKKAIE